MFVCLQNELPGSLNSCFISYLKQNDSSPNMYIRLPESLVYFFAYLSDFISSLLKVKLPITVDRVNALTSRAKFCQKRLGSLFTPNQSSEYLIKIISEQKPSDSGKFLAWDSSTIPW